MGSGASQQGEFRDAVVRPGYDARAARRCRVLPPPVHPGILPVLLPRMTDRTPRLGRRIGAVLTTSGVQAPVEGLGRERPQWRPRVPWLVALVVRLAAVFAVLDILHPVGRPRLESRALNGMVNGSIFAAAVFAAGAMLVLATGLEHRKRRAWVLAVAAVVLGIVTHVQVHRWSVVAVNVAVLVLLLLARRDFTAISERTGRVAALRVFLVMGGVSIVAGLFLTARTAPHSPLGSRLVEVLAGLVGFTPDLEFRAENASAITEISLNTLGALTALLTLLSLLAPARKPSTLAPDAEYRLRGLLDRFGARDSLGYFALRGDKTAIFSPSGKAAVVYRVVGSVTLAAGDPLGDPEAWPGAIQAWLDEADTTPGRPASSAPARTLPSPTAGPASTRWNWGTKPCCTWTSSASRGVPCGGSGKP